MNILFLVECHSQSGIGHWMRSTRLAQAFVDSGHQVTVLRDETMVIPMAVSDKLHMTTVETTLFNVQLHKELREKIAAGVLNQPDLLVVDGYQFSTEQRQSLRDLNCLIAAFDDGLGDSLHADCVINTAADAQPELYQERAPQAVLCLGPEFHCLGPEYNAILPLPLAQRRYLTIIMGGADPLRITKPLLQQLLTYTWPDSEPEIRVVTTSAYLDNEAIRTLAEANTNVVSVHDEYDLSTLFNQSRLVVSAAGVTAAELRACATPAILAATADNQRATMRYAVQAQHARGMVVTDGQALTELAALVCQTWQDNDWLRDCHQRLTGLRLNGCSKLVSSLETLVGAHV